MFSRARVLSNKLAKRRGAEGPEIFSHNHHSENGVLWGTQYGRNHGHQSWELPTFFWTGVCLMVTGVGMFFKPETSLQVWAREEAISRGFMTHEQAMRDLGKVRNRPADELNHPAWLYIEKLDKIAAEKAE